MFLEQLVRLIFGIFEIGFGIVLLAVFVMGITFISRGYETSGMIMAFGSLWFLISAIKNHR